VAVTGQIVVYELMVSVTTYVCVASVAGQFVTVEAQLVMVFTVVT
jgi:hypothetical protein